MKHNLVIAEKPIVQIPSYIAQVERKNIYQKQMEGIRQVKKRGVQFGRSKIELPKEFEIIAEQWNKREISLREGAKLLDVSYNIFSKRLKEKGYTREK